MQKILAYGLEWHISRSPSVKDILIDPLKGYCEVQFEGWDGEIFDTSCIKDKHAPIIFFMLPPPRNLLEKSDFRVVWIPMWDQIKGYPISWWKNLPPTLRVVSFSNQIFHKAGMANLETLKLKFFKDPSPVPQARFNSEKTLLYWNRVGLVSPQFLSKLCNILKIHKMFFRSKIDPRLPDNAYFKLPTTLGKTIVEVIPDMLPRHQYLSLVNKSNLFIAPRYYEGVGVTFLEALARGCVVFSANSPTMNEYIFHKTTGYLLKGSSEDNIGLRIAQKFKRAFKKLQNFGQSFPKYKISDSQKWTEIENLDLEELGNNARYQHMIGYEDWLKSLPNYSKFILDW